MWKLCKQAAHEQDDRKELAKHIHSFEQGAEHICLQFFQDEEHAGSDEELLPFRVT